MRYTVIMVTVITTLLKRETEQEIFNDIGKELGCGVHHQKLLNNQSAYHFKLLNPKEQSFSTYIKVIEDTFDKHLGNKEEELILEVTGIRHKFSDIQKRKKS